MGVDRARVRGASAALVANATTALVAVATIVLLGVMLSACGDKFAGKWKQKDGTRVLEIKNVSGSTYIINIINSPGQLITAQGTKQGDTLRVTDPGGSGAGITPRPVSGGLEVAFTGSLGGVAAYTYVRQ